MPLPKPGAGRDTGPLLLPASNTALAWLLVIRRKKKKSRVVALFICGSRQVDHEQVATVQGSRPFKKNTQAL